MRHRKLTPDSPDRPPKKPVDLLKVLDPAIDAGQGEDAVSDDAELMATQRFRQGRKKGCRDFVTVLQEKAKEKGLTLDDIAWAVIKSVVASAKKGNMTAAKMLLDRIFGPVEPSAIVDARSLTVENHGPQMPQDPTVLKKYFVQLQGLYKN